MSPESTLHQTKIRHLDLNNILTVDSTYSLGETIKIMQSQRSGCILITGGSDLLGIFTERDIVLSILGKRLEFSDVSLKEFMTTNPNTLRMQDPISFALNMMVDGGFRHIPIVDKNRYPKGIISILDIVEHLGHLFHMEIMNLPPNPLRKQKKQEGG